MVKLEPFDPAAPSRPLRAPRQARGRAATLALQRARERRPDWIDVREIRERMGITQVHFARMFAIPTATLRHWESRERKPRGPALVLLHVIAREPQAVLRALKNNQFRRKAMRAIELEDVRPVTGRKPLVMPRPRSTMSANTLRPNHYKKGEP